MNVARRKHKIALLVALFSIMMSAIQAQSDDSQDLYELSLEELLNLDVISASKSSEKLIDAPGVVQVITQEEIRRFGALNLAEVLDRATGAFNMSSFTYPQNVTSLRGDLANDFDTRVLLLLNGRRLGGESLYGGFNSSLYLGTPLSIIERIEIIRGPGSVLYGSSAYTGVVNIITKKAEATSGSLKTTTGSFGTLGATGDVSFVKKDLSLTAGFNTYGKEGWEFTASDIFGDTRTIDYLEKSAGLSLTGEYKNLSINTMYTQNVQRTFGLGVPLWDIGFGDPEDKQIDSRRFFADVGYSHDFSNMWKSDINVTYLGFDIESNITNLDEDNRSQDWLIELSNKLELTENFNLLLGGTAYYQSGRIELAPLLPYNNSWYGTYLQLDYRPAKSLKLIAGGQFNSIDGLKNDFVPRIGAIYNISEKVGTKLLWGRSFRAPYAVETKIEALSQRGNPNLSAEKLTNLDLQLFYVTENFEVYATYFNSNSANLITQVPIDAMGTTTFINLVDDLKGNGFELESKFLPSPSWFFTYSFSYQTNEVNAAGTKIENFTFMPNRMMKVGVSYQSPTKSWSIGLFNSSISSFNTDANPQPLAPFNNELSNMNLLSVNLSLNVKPLLLPDMTQDIILNLYGTNLLNEEINYPDFTAKSLNSFPGRPGAAYYGSLVVKF